MFLGRTYLAVILVGLFFSPVAAKTWHVEADGTGDFSVIQDAVDAATDGDIIAIGPGRFDQYSTDQTWGHFYVIIEGKDLTFVGSGPDVTFIGPSDPLYHRWPGPDVHLLCSYQASRLTIRDLTLEHSPYIQVRAHNARVEVDNCIVRGTGDGIYTRNSKGGYIRGSTFDRLNSFSSTSIGFHGPEQGVVIEDCRFKGGSLGI